MRDTLLGAFQQILPREASALMAKTVGQLNAGAVIGAGAVSAGLGSVWGALNGTWAMMTGLNKAYEVKEERPMVEGFEHRLRLDDCAGDHGSRCALGNALWQPGLGDDRITIWHSYASSPFLWRIIQWLVTVILLLFSFALLYRFGPSLKDRRWQWSVPGAVVAVTLWVASTLLLRVYQNHFSSQRIYGDLNAVVVLLLWLYFTGAAIFIGGEANSEIEKAAAKTRRARRRGICGKTQRWRGQSQQLAGRFGALLDHMRLSCQEGRSRWLASRAPFPCERSRKTSSVRRA